MGKGKVWFGPSNVWVYSIRQNAICIDFRQYKYLLLQIYWDISSRLKYGNMKDLITNLKLLILGPLYGH